MANNTTLKEITDFFEFKDGKQCCLVTDCKSKIQTLKTSALYRHFRQKHSSKLCEVVPQQKDISLEFLRQDTIYIAIEHIAVCGRTLNSIEDTSFRKLLKTMNQLKMNIHQYIHGMADKIRSRIREEFSNKHFSLMFDSATRHNRALLGVNIQSIKDGKLIQRTIGMEKMELRHTGQYIANMVNNLLLKYDIPIKKIVASTVDNANNIVSAVGKLDAMVSNASNQIDSDCSDDEEESGNIQQHWTSNEFQHDLLTCAAEEIGSEFKAILYENIECIRCAAHTIQLAVKAALRNANYNPIIDRARELVKKLRLQQIILLLEARRFPIPPLDGATRWFSLYSMVS